MTKIKKEKLSNQVYLVLKEMIENYRFQPGARIVVEDIARELGVSRTPVWEAINKLEKEGLVENKTNKGVYMTLLTSEDALNLYAVREVLESMAARLAAEKIEDQILQKMKDCLERQRPIVENKEMVEYSKIDFEYHALVYEACKNPFLKELLNAIKDKMRPINMHLQLVLPTLYEHHWLLFEALNDRDPKKAEAALKEHNQFLINHLKEEIANGNWMFKKEEEVLTNY